MTTSDYMVIDKICKMKGVKLKSETLISISCEVLELWRKPYEVDSPLPPVRMGEKTEIMDKGGF